MCKDDDAKTYVAVNRLRCGKPVQELSCDPDTDESVCVNFTYRKTGENGLFKPIGKGVFQEITVGVLLSCSSDGEWIPSYCSNGMKCDPNNSHKCMLQDDCEDEAGCPEMICNEYTRDQIKRKEYGKKDIYCDTEVCTDPCESDDKCSIFNIYFFYFKIKKKI